MQREAPQLLGLNPGDGEFDTTGRSDRSGLELTGTVRQGRESITVLRWNAASEAARSAITAACPAARQSGSADEALSSFLVGTPSARWATKLDTIGFVIH